MCFSAEASFTAAAGLSICGGVLVNRFKDDRKKIFLALIPIFFALQQFSEGMLWMAFNREEYGTFWSHMAQYSFMFFAYLFWPIWIPFAYLLAEVVEWRKYIMAATLLMSMLFYCYLVFQFFATPSVEAKVVGHSIVYAPGSQFSKLYYVAVVLVPIFFSSLPRMWMVGVLTGISFFAADYFYTYAFASMWCFASAVIFSSLFFVLETEEEK